LAANAPAEGKAREAAAPPPPAEGKALEAAAPPPPEAPGADRACSSCATASAISSAEAPARIIMLIRLAGVRADILVLNKCVFANVSSHLVDWWYPCLSTFFFIRMESEPALRRFCRFHGSGLYAKSQKLVIFVWFLVLW
jgi:hypothetical protein